MSGVQVSFPLLLESNAPPASSQDFTGNSATSVSKRMVASRCQPTGWY